MLRELNAPGTSVSPAPRSAPPPTIAAAKNGSAKATARSAAAPSRTMSGSRVKRPMRWGAANQRRTPPQAIANMPHAVARKAKLRAAAARAAPTACPTIVWAAARMPMHGR